MLLARGNQAIGEGPVPRSDEVWMEARMHLGGTSTCPGRARRFVAHFLGNWAERTLRDTALLLVSELVTNAVVHANSEVEISVARSIEPKSGEPRLLRVEVHDANKHFPAAHCISADTESGRGLVLVDALANRWGVTPKPNGKAVWFELLSLVGAKTA